MLMHTRPSMNYLSALIFMCVCVDILSGILKRAVGAYDWNNFFFGV